MKKRTIISIIAGLVILAVITAAGVHILHKKAYAQIYYYKIQCYFWDEEEDEWTPAEGVQVSIFINGLEFEQFFWTNANGVAVTNQEFASWWIAEVHEGVNNWQLDPGQDNPQQITGPCTWTFYVNTGNN